MSKLITIPTRLTMPSHFMGYFENMAVKRVAHSTEDPRKKRFFRSYDDIQGGNIQGIIMVAFSVPSNYSGDDAAVVKHSRYQFEVLKQVGNNRNEIAQAIDECMVINNMILSKIRYDSDPLRLGNRRIEQFDLTDVETDEINDPVFGYVGVYSVVAMGNIENDLIYDNAQWL